MDYCRYPYFKIISISIVWSLISWSLYLNFYSETNLFQLLIMPAKYSLNLTYIIYNTSLKAFSNIQDEFSNLEALAFSLSILLCITFGLILSKITFILIKKCYNIFKRFYQ